MVRVMKSPNMMSTTGRSPVMAAPTASPVNPASEIGVSRTRSLPNSSTRPERTLNGVPASATSSPMMQTCGSRRISSASASRTACPKVSSRGVVSDIAASGIDVLLHFVDRGIRRGNREFHRFVHLSGQLGLNLTELRRVGELLLDQEVREILNRVALRLPGLFFLLRAVVLAVNIADVVAGVAIGIGQEKRRAAAAAGALDQAAGRRMHGTNVLPIDGCSFESERGGAGENIAGSRLGIVGVLGVEIVFANKNDRQQVERSEEHTSE